LGRAFRTLTFKDLQAVYGDRWTIFENVEHLNHGSPFPPRPRSREVRATWVPEALAEESGQIVDLLVTSERRSWSRWPLFEQLVERHGLPCRIEYVFGRNADIIFQWHDPDQPVQLSYAESGWEMVFMRDYERGLRTCRVLRDRARSGACLKMGEYFKEWPQREAYTDGPSSDAR